MVTETKKQTVEEFAKLLEEYPVIATINMANLPAPQLQKMREQLRGKVVLRMVPTEGGFLPLIELHLFADARSCSLLISPHASFRVRS